MNIEDYVKTSKDILNKLPGFMSIIDTQHRIIWANDKAVKSFGFKSLDEIFGKRYADLKYGIYEKSHDIEIHDKLIFKLRRNIGCLSYLQYSDGFKLSICEKSPIMINENKPIGLTNYWTDITSYALVDISRFVFSPLEKSNRGSKKQFSYYLQDKDSNHYLLSERQLECLFFLLRGKSDKDIAKILRLSPRTVESYIQEIKLKMLCLTRGQIIEKSFNEGLINSLPVSFIQKVRDIESGN